MKKSRFSEAQVIAVLKEHEAGVKTADLCRKHGISSATLYAWKSKFSRLEVSDIAKMRALEDGNRRSKQIVADQALYIDALKISLGKLLKPAQRRLGVQAIREALDVSKRAACHSIGANRRMVRYVSIVQDDVQLRELLHALAVERWRFGIRRRAIMLQRAGVAVGMTRLSPMNASGYLMPNSLAGPCRGTPHRQRQRLR